MYKRLTEVPPNKVRENADRSHVNTRFEDDFDFSFVQSLLTQSPGDLILLELITCKLMKSAENQRVQELR